MTGGDCVLAVDDLGVGIGPRQSPLLVDGVSLRVHEGECLGIVGESGSGKSLTLRAMLGLLPSALRETGDLRFADEDGVLAARTGRQLRGGGVSLVFQEPMTSLNPTMRVRDLVAAGARARGLSRRAAARRALELLAEVGYPDPAGRGAAWPHELSGGLRQRVMIAMALSVEPRVLLCDEPTTALDVTVQDQILSLIERLRRDHGLGVVFVTHDLAVVSRIADVTAVMYAGRIVEQGPTAELLARPRHPYTRGLLAAVPRPVAGRRRLETIPGNLPAPGQRPTGCRFEPRCGLAAPSCRAEDPPLVRITESRSTACPRHQHLALEESA